MIINKAIEFMRKEEINIKTDEMIKFLNHFEKDIKIEENSSLSEYYSNLTYLRGWIDNFLFAVENEMEIIEKETNITDITLEEEQDISYEKANNLIKEKYEKMPSCDDWSCKYYKGGKCIDYKIKEECVK